MLERRLEDAWRNRQIEDAIPIRLSRRRFDLAKALPNRLVGAVGAEVSAGVKRPLAEPLPNVLLHLVDVLRLIHRLPHQRSISLIGVLISGDAQKCEIVGQKLLLGEVVNGRDELSLGQIASSAEDDHRARVGLVATARRTRRAHERNRTWCLHDFFTA